MHSPIVGTTDVIVVGAGYTGLAVAKALQEDSRLSFRVLEATDRVGGRTLNVDVVTGRQSVISDDVIELGGEWLPCEGLPGGLEGFPSGGGLPELPYEA